MAAASNAAKNNDDDEEKEEDDNKKKNLAILSQVSSENEDKINNTINNAINKNNDEIINENARFRSSIISDDFDKSVEADNNHRFRISSQRNKNNEESKQQQFLNAKFNQTAKSTNNFLTVDFSSRLPHQKRTTTTARFSTIQENNNDMSSSSNTSISNDESSDTNNRSSSQRIVGSLKRRRASIFDYVDEEDTFENDSELGLILKSASSSRCDMNASNLSLAGFNAAVTAGNQSNDDEEGDGNFVNLGADFSCFKSSTNSRLNNNSIDNNNNANSSNKFDFLITKSLNNSSNDITSSLSLANIPLLKVTASSDDYLSRGKIIILSLSNFFLHYKRISFFFFLFFFEFELHLFIEANKKNF